ncbi:MAG: hypothetical protein QOF01_3847 [Thermomicrobiales bacterium]|nr:hypothetical protein [Thermomicrobiales bacterium]
MFGEPFLRLRNIGGRKLSRVVNASMPITEHLDEDVVLPIGVLRIRNVLIE